jgi:hypothetical protein
VGAVAGHCPSAARNGSASATPAAIVITPAQIPNTGAGRFGIG